MKDKLTNTWQSVARKWHRYVGTISVIIIIISFFLLIMLLLLTVQEAERNVERSRAQGEQNSRDINTLTAEIRRMRQEILDDHKLDRRYEDCLLLVLPQNRTTDTIRMCRERAVSPTGLDKDADSLFNRSSLQGVQQERQQRNDAGNEPESNPRPNPSPKPEPQPPQEPDNDGVILDLPLLPKVHIPSPL